jgi:hypothetical protein
LRFVFGAACSPEYLLFRAFDSGWLRLQEIQGKRFAAADSVRGGRGGEAARGGARMNDDQRLNEMVDNLAE